MEGSRKILPSTRSGGKGIFRRLRPPKKNCRNKRKGVGTGKIAYVGLKTGRKKKGSWMFSTEENSRGGETESYVKKEIAKNCFTVV